MEARSAVEEDMMARVPMSKEDAKKLKQQKRMGMSGALEGVGARRQGRKESQAAEAQGDGAWWVRANFSYVGLQIA